MRPMMTIAAIAALAILTLPASAQRRTGPPVVEASEKEKAALAEKRSRDKAIDAAYRATLKKMPDKQEKPDPWGNLRAPAGQ